MMMNLVKYSVAVFSIIMSDHIFAQDLGLSAITMIPGDNGEQTYTVSLQILAVMTALSMLPAAILMMTSFTRIIIVLAILRQALGTAQTPSNQILLGISLFLTFFIMSPVFDKIYVDSLQPYMDEQITQTQALERAAQPIKTFMLAQTREDDIALFMNISEHESIASPEETPFSILIPSFVTSELKTAFQIGFIIFIPFVVIDLVVASVLMAMGMMMLSPMIISLPFKLMLFVLIDGWSLIMGTLASSFYLGSA